MWHACACACGTHRGGCDQSATAFLYAPAWVVHAHLGQQGAGREPSIESQFFYHYCSVPEDAVALPATLLWGEITAGPARRLRHRCPHGPLDAHGWRRDPAQPSPPTGIWFHLVCGELAASFWGLPRRRVPLLVSLRTTHACTRTVASEVPQPQPPAAGIAAATTAATSSHTCAPPPPCCCLWLRAGGTAR